MPNRLHLVFGGELKDPAGTEFCYPDQLDVVGNFPSYQATYDAWKAAAQATVDDAHVQYFIAHLHRLQDEKQENSVSAEPVT